jgi:hypothetical protein
MSLLKALKSAKTEEDVKAVYIATLDIKSYTMGLVDIQTDEIWIEAKEAGTSPIAMFAQLLVYLNLAHKKESICRHFWL